MSTAQPGRLVRGLIVQATVFDQAGRAPKPRPVVLLTGEDDVAPGRPLIGIAITATLPTPLTPDHVLLPWQHNKHPHTGLKKRCAAVCTWFVKIPSPADVEVHGRVPDKQFREIWEKVALLDIQIARLTPPFPPASPSDPGQSGQ